MNVNDLIILGAVAALLLTALVVIVIPARRNGRKLKNSLSEMDEMRNALSTLRTELEGVKQPMATPAPAPGAWVPTPALTADQRAGALEMLRNGANPATVSATMSLPHAETALLHKVQRLLDSTALAR